MQNRKTLHLSCLLVLVRRTDGAKFAAWLLSAWEQLVRNPKPQKCPFPDIERFSILFCVWMSLHQGIKCCFLRYFSLHCGQNPPICKFGSISISNFKTAVNQYSPISYLFPSYTFDTRSNWSHPLHFFSAPFKDPTTLRCLYHCHIPPDPLLPHGSESAIRNPNCTFIIYFIR